MVDEATKVEHTPTPWVATKERGAHMLSVRGGVRDGWPIGGRTIYEVKERRKGAQRGEQRKYLGFDARDEEDAEFVVRAVNSHDELLAACRNALQYIIHMGDASLRGENPSDELRVAIAKAEGVK